MSDVEDKVGELLDQFAEAKTRATVDRTNTGKVITWQRGRCVKASVGEDGVVVFFGLDESHRVRLDSAEQALAWLRDGTVKS